MSAIYFMHDTDAATGARYRVNPRAASYLRATGLTLDNWKPWEFVQWNSARLHEARRDIPHAFYMALLIDHEAYNTWLDKRVDDHLSGARPIA